MSRIDTLLYTTPDAASGSPRTAIIDLIDSAKHTIEFGIFSFTSRGIAAALIAAHQRRVKITGVVDATQALVPTSQYAALVAAGIDVRRYGIRQRLMHSKILLVDGSYSRLTRLVLGSYNWTTGAEDTNYEVLTVSRGTPVSKEFAPVIRAQLSAAYAKGFA